MSTRKETASNILSLLCIVGLLLSLVGCDIGAPPAPTPPTPSQTPSPPPVTPTSPAPVSPQVIATPTAACTAPAISSQVELLSLPGAVRVPLAMTMFKDRIYVAGRTSDNLGIVENGRLARVLPVGDGPSSLAVDESLGRIFVLNTDERTLALFDGQEIRATIPISNPQLPGYQYPAGMVVDSQNHRLYVLVTSNRTEIAVVDTQSLAVVGRIPIESRSLGSRLTLDAANNRLFVGHYDHVSVIDLRINMLVETIQLPGSSYRIIAYDAKTRRLFTDHYKDSSFIAVIENGSMIATVPVGADPYHALIVGERLYVTNSYSHTVSVIDIQSLRPIATIPVGPSPRVLVADPSGERVYVSIEGFYGREFNRLEVIDTRRNEVVGLIPLMSQASQLVADNSRNRLYALLPSSNQLLISDGQRLLSQVPLERAPFQMALDEATGRLYITDYLSGNLNVIDVAGGRLIERKALNLAARLNAVAVDKSRNRLLVNNRAFSLDQLAPTGQYSITGFTVPYGDGIQPDRLLVNPTVPRFYAVAWNGVPGSNSGTTLYMFDGEALRQMSVTGDRNVSALVLDDAAQRVYAAGTHPLALTTRLSVFDALTFSRSNSLDLPTRVTAMALNPKTHHLFLSYLGYTGYPNPSDNKVDVLDTRTLGRIATFSINPEPMAMAVLGDRIYLSHGAGNTLTVIRDCATDIPPAPTPTRTPTPYPTLPPTPTPTVTRTPTPAPPRPTPTPATACAIPMASWVQTPENQTFDFRANLGCPTEPSHAIRMAQQNFQNGLMFWREDTRKILVINYDGTWQVFDDTWDASQPEGGTERPPSPDLRAPKRGFGKVWREQLGGASAAIGWALNEERMTGTELQTFERGFALKDERGDVRLLVAVGSWR